MSQLFFRRGVNKIQSHKEEDSLLIPEIERLASDWPFVPDAVVALATREACPQLDAFLMDAVL